MTKFDDVDVLITRNSLRDLLRFCDGKCDSDFRINLLLIEKTLIVERCAKSEEGLIVGRGNSGRGHSFEKAISLPQDGMENTTRTTVSSGTIWDD